MEAGGARVAFSKIFNASLATLCQAFLASLRNRIEPVTCFTHLAFGLISGAGLAAANCAGLATLIFTWWRVDDSTKVAGTNTAFVVVTYGLATGLRVAAGRVVVVVVVGFPTGRATEIVARGLATLLLGVSNRAVNIDETIRT